MSMDGSFSLQSAVERFLARCPALAGVKKFDDVAKKGHMVTEEDVLSLLPELFVHPDYTIPLIGCFRPLARRIVDRAVALLRHCNLRSDLEDTLVLEPGRYVEDGLVFVIEHYERCGRGLLLNELACLAFCRALDLAPNLLGSVSSYFKFAPPPFARMLRKDNAVRAELYEDATQYLCAVRISCRLLLLEPELFAKHWDWSCFLDVVLKSLNVDLGHAITDIRWCGIRILSTILNMNDKATGNLGVGDEEAASCLLRWEEFCQDVAVEKAGLFLEAPECKKLCYINGDIDFSQQNCQNDLGFSSQIMPQFHQTEPPFKSRKLMMWDGDSAGNPYVITSAVKRSFEMVLLAVSQKWPVLLYGPAGAGKTALISKLARDAGNQVLYIHMDDQIDGKTLIGGYVCTEQPGEFRWQPGSLVQAVVNGYWVVFEDINKAPSDVQSILWPLLEGASSFVTSHGEEIRVPESFRLFSTITTPKNDLSRHIEGGNLLSSLWRRVMIGPPSKDDLANIIKTLYPSLEPFAGKLIETLRQVNASSPHRLGGFQSGDLASFDPVGRFSLRDLLKWCKRIVGSAFRPTGDVLTTYQRAYIYQEAVDIFGASSISADNRVSAAKEIARMWAISGVDAANPSKPIIQVLGAELKIGRITLDCSGNQLSGQENLVKMRSSLHVLERIACSVKYNEPVLLVGETGTGKTTLVQNLAMMLGQKLTVLNLSQQSDVADLLGGFKPMDPQSICVPLYREFESLFTKSFSKEKNAAILTYLQRQLTGRNWKALLVGFKKCIDAQRKAKMGRSSSEKKRKKLLDEEAWEGFSMKVESAYTQVEASSGMMFSFVEGAFVTALRNGEWILLDEVNLAPPETLQRIIGVLEGEHGSLCLAERGDVSHLPRHPSFRIFGCMNPANDAGKRDLPYSLRSRFTEYFVDDVLDKEDLKLFINKFMEESQSNSELDKKITDFYETAKKNSEEKLQDGANQKPQYSLRSLYRALEYIREAKGKFGFQKAIYDGFCMFFLTLLDRPSAKIMNKMIIEKLLGGSKPPSVHFHAYLRVAEDFKSYDFLQKYVLTSSVEQQLENLARAVFIKRYPVLLQGPTSSGKTSLVQYLAARTGHEFVRINNHEHTDLQEYLGSYVSDAQGKLVFQEGVLVKAVRNGYWIVLDELNLAPSDVLEALNRLLDDNRELFVPELRETVRAHPNFMLFATQNPPTLYGGRKMLSRAFRNRFVEVHVDEIPDDELSTIIEKRCEIPGSRARLMVEIMKDLQLHRQSSKVFAGKHGFITPRDLFRWASRLKKFGDSKEVMAEHGYYLLADRLRDEREKLVVQEVLEKHLRVKIVKDKLYQESGNGRSLAGKDLQSFGNVILTESMRRLYFLIKHCYELHEPVLLVGETGGGKTTVCQLLSSKLGRTLRILNCHQYTETSDFLGGFYPVRERSRLMSEYKTTIEELKLSKAYTCFSEDSDISHDIGQAAATLRHLTSIASSYREGRVSCGDVTAQDLDNFERMNLILTQLHQKWQTIFVWQDGPLVQAMEHGDIFLIDEISLADDSVLERLNSVLEPERRLSLAEKGGSTVETVDAHQQFLVLATMNPGGDFGKKELSPALRNRFTEIWVPAVSDLRELRDIASERLSNQEFLYIVDAMSNFWDWFNQLQTGRMLTVRDLLSWVEFFNATKGSLGPDYAFLHGLFLVLLDGLSLGTGVSRRDAGILREKCLSFLLRQLKLKGDELHELSIMENYGWGDPGRAINISSQDAMQSDDIFGISPFFIRKGFEDCGAGGFEFLAPTTRRNALRVLRAMQLPKPVLLEGSPGVGKTSLVIALGRYSGHKVVRINLSEQTDLMDLLGSDLPVESNDGLKFAWSDGILLQALKEGSWVLLDELNLAPQSGLNAILDHRAEVFIPELGLTFKCPSSFRLFACQNPFSQGGGRKGLPKSFLNRFTKVYVDELVEDDYLSISGSLYPSIPRPVLSKLILFNKRLHEEVMLYRKFAQDGSPWEFNLRDVIRSCQIIKGAPNKSAMDCFLNILYVQRMRTEADRREVLRLYEEVFAVKPFINPYPRVQLDRESLIVGNCIIKRNTFQSSKASIGQLNIIPSIRHTLEAVAHCIQNQWLCILVGPPSSGKTSSVRLLATLTGNVLNELNLSSATDISELLGCFEQYNAFRNFRLVVAQMERYFNEYCSLQFEFSKVEFIKERKDTISKWLSFLSDADTYSLLSSSVYLGNWERVVSSLGLLIEIIKEIEWDVETNGLHVSWSHTELDRLVKAISNLQEGQHGTSFSAKFEWVTGLLIKAIENGEWIVLENANLCSPTVLDRINSLVETSGSITVNECGIVDGGPVVLHPHPNFRMFLTVNPSFGEISRAMRNRGVEIYVMQPYWLFDVGNDHMREEFELKDAKRFLVSSGIAFGKLVDCMAKAHIYATKEGRRFDVQITYLELGRWVQLFQQLLMNGNGPSWSLQMSWEHTYLSSFGESVGWDIISHGKLAFLTDTTVVESDWPVEYLLFLPGGWPMPLNLWDFIWHSRESSVKQNCMYLEYLVSQYEFGSRSSLHHVLSSASKSTSLMDVETLHGLMFPNASSSLIPRSEFDVKLAKKMLLFASNWSIEQATERDYKLYLLRLGSLRFNQRGLDHFFSSFLRLLTEEMKHPIWRSILDCRNQLVSVHGYNLQTKPLLSLELVDFTAPCDTSNLSCELLSKAVNSVGLLRLSYEQWSTESGHVYNTEALKFKPILKALKKLEKQILNKIVDCTSYDMLVKLYTDLIEAHMVFWNAVTSLGAEQLFFSWRSLMKNVLKLHDCFPEAVEQFIKSVKDHMIRSGLDEVINQSAVPSLLWTHGGHPILPSSADLYDKQKLLLELCESVWPTRANPYEQVNNSPLAAIASTNPELRFLALQGICMSSYITSICDEDDALVVQQLQDMHQMLLERFEHEKCKLEGKFRPNDHTILEESSACCALRHENFCGDFGTVTWHETVPIVDCTSFSLDMELLQKLQVVVLTDPRDTQLALGDVRNLLESAIKYSLTSSARPPQNFIPHQKLLWTIDAWGSVDAVDAKVISYVLELWFWWHSSLWSHGPFSLKNLKMDGYELPQPDILLQPVGTGTVIQILQSRQTIKDYVELALKLKVASYNFWQNSPPGSNLSSFLLSVARSLFEQIIFVHEKVFDAETFIKLKSMFCSLRKNMITQVDIKELSNLIETRETEEKATVLTASSNKKIRNPLPPTLIKPILAELYHNYASSDPYLRVGKAWLQIGELRFSLLLSFGDVDPAMKYSVKYSNLEERISSLQLDMKVRQECDYLAGWSPLRELNKNREEALARLEVERKRVRRKMVFRCNSKKFGALKKECSDFHQHIKQMVKLVDMMEALEVKEMLNQVCNWQETAACFIERLSDEYSEYIDVAQPVQVAVYEMKLGLSLILSVSSLKSILNAVEMDNVDQVMELVYSFMRFPRGYLFQSISSDVSDIPPNFWELELSMLEKMLSVLHQVNAENMDSALQLKATLHQNILLRVAHFVADARRIDNASFKMLDKIFHEFADLWMNMKVELKNKEGHEAQDYKFRTRAFRMASIVDVDISTLQPLAANDSFLEWQELLSEEECLEKEEAAQGNGNLEDEWNLMEETVMDNVIRTHNRLFGSPNLVLPAGMFHISNGERLSSFADSYRLGAGMIRGFGGLLASGLDAKLVPEHLLRLCLEHESQFGVPLKSSTYHNFYKDSNGPELAKMVNLLADLLNKIVIVLGEREDHPGLRKIMNAIEMLLAIPMGTPLAKALSGLQFLLNRIELLRESGSKFSLSGQLEPIISLVCKWKKLEFDSWPALLEEVQIQFDNNAMRELNLKILYNVFGYYIQFLPRILDYIETSRRNILMELKELVKLCHWERNEACISVENSKRTRQKLRKLIEKYTAILQQPLMLILKQEVEQIGSTFQSQQVVMPVDASKKKLAASKNVSNVMLLNDEDRSTWFHNWRAQVCVTVNNLERDWTSDLSFLDTKGVTGVTDQSLSSWSVCLMHDDDHWSALCQTVEKICRRIADCDDLWRESGKGVVKQRALADLLKLLENSGLHKHKFEMMKVSDDSNWLLIQPSYVSQHLLPNQSIISCSSYDVSTASESHYNHNESQDTDWKMANEFYFKSWASVQFLQSICLKPHKDLTLKQTRRSISFLNHLIVIQQSQRATAYSFAKHLKCLRRCVHMLGNLYSKPTGVDRRSTCECSLVQNHYAILKCMWKQKRLFDSLNTILVEESMLLRTVESAHLKSCESVRPDANHLLQFIEKCIPVVKGSKESLDNHLLGCAGGSQSLLPELSDEHTPCYFGAAGRLQPDVITKPMQQLVYKNFQVIKELEEQVLDFGKHDSNKTFVIQGLLAHIDDVLKRGKFLEGELDIDSIAERTKSTDLCEDPNCGNTHYSGLESEFQGALRVLFEQVVDVLRKQCTLTNECILSEETLGNITSWEYVFKSSMETLNLDGLYDNLIKTIYSAVKWTSCSYGENSCSTSHIGTSFMHLHLLFDLVLTMGDGLLEDLLAMNKTVAVMTHTLANVLASLFSKGFGIPSRDEADDASHDASQDASGTGMGEGSGLKDVSDQITDEDQLLGISKQPGEQEDASGEVPDTNNGIEMTDDFQAETYSISEDSEEEVDEDSEDEQVDSAMGEAGDGSEAVDEKPWDKEKDENPNTNEKYESGSSMAGHDTGDSELRGREDPSADIDDKPGELGEENEEVKDQDGTGDDEENQDGMSMDKEEAYADQTGLELDESSKKPNEDMDLDETKEEEDLDLKEEEGLDQEEEKCAEEDGEAAENRDDEDNNSHPADDENMDDVNNELVSEISEKPGPGSDSKETSEMELTASMEGVFGPGSSDVASDLMPVGAPSAQPNGDSQASESRNAAPDESITNTNGAYDDNNTEMDVIFSGSSRTGKFSVDQQKTHLPHEDSSSVPNTQLNPYRNVGNALEEWKERVKVSVDIQAEKAEVPGEMEEENANEYGYVSELEKGTAQALGPASTEQIDPHMDINKPEEDNHAAQRNDAVEMETDKQTSEQWLPTHSILKNKVEEKSSLPDLEKLPKEGPSEIDIHHDGDPAVLESVVSIKTSYSSGNSHWLSKLSPDESNQGNAQEPEEISLNLKGNAADLWRRYELVTTQLSQELAEQLRLIMEPTLASKLQGDYKTGKRINMKKVIPYIASHYRKDKIWLRRTRPNKRDYQVVIAVDDSQSMSETGCGNVAIEALVTVCRAMSQVEMGNLAVASFGKKGNIRLLHDFDHPFTGEAGTKIISNLTFSQENTIVDEPVVDLLKYLNNMLDTAVAKARLPSGHNPLQQLVLIIADGRFHEKEKLKRCVRDFLSQKRMVAFLLLDSPRDSAQGSIMDYMEASFVGGSPVPQFTKYLDSFPFPYYIVLRHIEALPRTLADLLRQNQLNFGGSCTASFLKRHGCTEIALVLHFMAFSISPHERISCSARISVMRRLVQPMIPPCRRPAPAAVASAPSYMWLLGHIYSKLMTNGFRAARHMTSKYANGIDAFRKIIRMDGVRGLYRGFGISILTYAPSPSNNMQSGGGFIFYSSTDGVGCYFCN
ncbi:hypothetical protein Tsubulata_018473 [Turnera subulata]|uniref:Midasin n=1 Tax=Turnera subulata TaxID=218843 RepID=A0A9Q0FU75_9ROSI|nr:hypothetical protein Tsubulata_018473 [Turnera subulata]